jgi:hypothetical protein
LIEEADRHRFGSEKIIIRNAKYGRVLRSTVDNSFLTCFLFFLSDVSPLKMFVVETEGIIHGAYRGLA